ncbi:MAG: response regulator [Gammaproteobacteria bacterium]|nr:response regulator [Gammaproteobacteria bacterium]MCW9055592.1 response regulator [Gammaproteobacteria bacterium]
MTDQKGQFQLLIVDDSRVIRRAATKILEKEFDVVEAEDGEDAWEEIQKNKNISAVFTDLGMPNLDGYGLLKKIRESDDPAIANLPVIIITGAEESEGAKEEVLSLGATDFISKPFDSVSLKSRASSHINYRNEVQSLEKRVATDKLTGLATEAVFNEQGEKSLAYAERHCAELTLVRFELNKFADFFVKYGKNVSEQILVKVASIVEQGLRKEDVAGRLGVAKFSLLLMEADVEGATQVVMRICNRLKSMKLKLGKEVVQLSFNAGITTFEKQDEGITFDQLCGQADEALKKSADAGECQLVHYKTGKTVEETPAIKHIETDIEEVIKKMADDQSSVSQAELASVVRKFIPILEAADQQLKLGLSKVVPHLKKRLNLD